MAGYEPSMRTALDVLPLATAREELRIPDRDHDGLLETQIAAAVDWVAAETSLPLVDVTADCAVPRGAASAPVLVPGAAVRRIERIAWWSPDASPSGDPDRRTVAAWGRLDVRPGAAFVWPPPAGWPAGRSGTPLVVTVTRGLDPVPPALRSACVLALRQLYDGAAEIHATAAVYALVQPWRRLAPAAG